MSIPSRFLMLLAICLFVTSCGEKKDLPSEEAPIPSDSVLSAEKMVHLLADVHMAEAALMMERNQGQDSKVKQEAYYRGIFKKYHISQRRFDENLRYYRQNPAVLSKIYDKVIQELEARQKFFPPVK